MVDSPPALAGLATALPPHRVSQREAAEHAAMVFSGLPQLDRLLALFDRAGVETRYTAQPPSYYLTPHSFGERNDAYLQAARSLAARAATAALAEAAVEPAQVNAVVLTTTTGLATPSLDAMLAEDLGLPPAARRVPLFGLGCAGGAGALALAAEWLASRPQATALVVAVELCSLTLLNDEVSKVNLVGAALFGDGAGAAVLRGATTGSAGPRVLGTGTRRFPGTAHFMGWRFSERGFLLELSPRVPAFVAESLPDPVRSFLRAHGVPPREVTHYALHPGGRQVLAAYRKGMGLSESQLAPTARALAEVGNLSSASVFFSLERVMRDSRPQPGETALMAALGPGFSAEFLLWGW